MNKAGKELMGWANKGDTVKVERWRESREGGAQEHKQNTESKAKTPQNSPNTHKIH